MPKEEGRNMDDSFPQIIETYRARLRRAYEKLGAAYGKPFERMEQNVITAMEHQVDLWERQAAAVAKCRSEAPDVNGKRVVEILCAYTFGYLTRADLADPAVKRVIQLTDGLFRGSQRAKVLGTDEKETVVRRWTYDPETGDWRETEINPSKLA